MPIERNLDDPRTDAELIRQRAGQTSQEDLQLDQRPRPQGRVAMLVIALVALFGVVVYSMTSKPVPPDAKPVAQTAPASPTGTTAQLPRAPIGQTTGSAPSSQTAPTNSAPTAPSSN